MLNRFKTWVEKQFFPKKGFIPIELEDLDFPIENLDVNDNSVTEKHTSLHDKLTQFETHIAAFKKQRTPNSSKQIINQLNTDVGTDNNNNNASSNPNNPVEPEISDTPVIDLNELNDRERIGKGNYGRVYKYTWKNSVIAIKSLDYQSAGPNTLVDCENERKILQFATDRMKPHEHFITRIVGYANDEKSQHYFLGLEFASQGKLTDLFSSDLFTAEFAFKAAYNVISAVAFLHRYQIIHRDVKSHNVVVNEKGEAQLCDFGNATFSFNKKYMNEMVGTPGWMAPELFQKYHFEKELSLTDKIDIFSYGTFLWELTSRKEPFKDYPGNLFKLSLACLKGLRETIPEGVNPKLASHINSCWAKHPHLRLTAEALQKELTLDEFKPAPKNVSR